MANFIDIKGIKYNSLLVIEKVGKDNSGSITWKCLCDCGNYSTVDSKSLRTGKTKTCGCSRKKSRPHRVKHGETELRIYNIWANIKNRCTNKNDINKFKYYGGRGITVCDEWMEYIPFRDWALQSGYEENLTIDRINNDCGYCPENCKWSTIKEQCQNRRSNKKYSFDGKTLSAIEWAKLLNVSTNTIYSRMKKGGNIYGKSKNPLAEIN